MEYLPDHILEEIFDYLSPSELLNTTLVSTKLNETISSTKRLTEKLNLYLSLIEDIEPKKNFSSLIRSSRKYHKFKISLDCGFDDFIPYEEDFFNVLKKLNYIKKFELVHSKLSYRNLIKIFSFFECLESIKLRDVVVYEGEDFKFGEPLKFSRLKVC